MKVEGRQIGMIAALETLNARTQRWRFLQRLSLASIGGATALQIGNSPSIKKSDISRVV